jgi:hypothetical protein
MTQQCHDWRVISRGDLIPEEAVLAGTTKEGQLYIARSRDAEASGCGKINLEHGKVGNILIPGFKGGMQSGDILVATGTIEWKKVRKGEPVPPFAVCAVRCIGGDLYPCRHNESEPGQLTAINGHVDKMHYHGHWTAKREAEILCVKPSSQSPALPDCTRSSLASVEDFCDLSPTRRPHDLESPPSSLHEPLLGSPEKPLLKALPSIDDFCKIAGGSAASSSSREPDSPPGGKHRDDEKSRKRSVASEKASAVKNAMAALASAVAPHASPAPVDPRVQPSDRAVAAHPPARIVDPEVQTVA